MKIIDEKGRIFGKVNIIDFLVIVFLFCLMPMLYFGYKIMVIDANAPKKEFIEIETDCQFIKIKPEVLKLISVGDKELDENEQVIGEIISLGQSAPYKYEFDMGKGQKIIKEDSILKQIEAKVKLKTEVKQNQLYYKDKVIEIGLPLEFKTNKYDLMAVFLKEEKGDRAIDLYVVLKDLDEGLLKEVSVGDKELDRAGNTIAEILSLGKIENSSVDFNLGYGTFVTGEDSSKRQISTKMRLRCQMKDDAQLYFKGEKLEHRKPFEFETDKYKVSGLVGKTFEVISSIREKWLSLEVKFTGVIPEIVNIVRKGDIEKDVFDKKVARTVSVITNKPSQVLTVEKNKLFTLNHPFRRDILLSLDILCMEKEGSYYFKNYPVKIGNNITFVTDLYSITGLIVGLEMR